jgi:hypothetical protein
VLVRLGQEVQEVPRRLGVAALLLAAVFCATGDAASKSTVTISGRAYAFNHMDTYLAGATIRVRELPKLSATTDANGDYTLKVPNDTDVTPYIEPPPGYHQIDLQTFHTRGAPISNANFQTPGDAEYNGLAALLSVPLGPDGRPTECVIVTTASARDVRGVDYETFHQRTPHGVAGATAHAVPALPQPTYFNENVIPDPNQKQTSGDGGIIWAAVPAGTYRVITESASTRFASFLATCEPGRIVNANPPWGAYELTGKEKPLGAGVVAGKLEKVSATDPRRILVIVDAAERLKVTMTARQRGDRVGPRAKSHADPGSNGFDLVLPRSAESGRTLVTVKLSDKSGDAVTDSAKLNLPRK